MMGACQTTLLAHAQVFNACACGITLVFLILACCSNVLLRKVFGMGAIKIKWPLNIRLQGLPTSGNSSVGGSPGDPRVGTFLK